MKERFIEIGIEYVKCGDYYLPNFELPQTQYDSGKYGRMRLQFLKTSKPDAKDDIADINIKLKELRSKLRMCNNILEDAERIQIRYNRVLELEEEAERQNRYRNKNQIMR